MEYLSSLPRKLIRWVCVLGVLWVFLLADVMGFPVDDTRALTILCFVTSVYGFREWGKIRGHHPNAPE